LLQPRDSRFLFLHLIRQLPNLTPLRTSQFLGLLRFLSPMQCPLCGPTMLHSPVMRLLAKPDHFPLISLHLLLHNPIIANRSLCVQP
jgi:hypothetical protein